MIDIEKEVNKRVTIEMDKFKKDLKVLIKENQSMAMTLINLCKDMDKCEHCRKPIRKIKNYEDSV